MTLSLDLAFVFWDGYIILYVDYLEKVRIVKNTKYHKLTAAMAQLYELHFKLLPFTTIFSISSLQT